MAKQILPSSDPALSARTHATDRVRLGEIEIFFRSFGEAGGTPVLIAHGMSYFSYDWIGVAAALATDRRVVALDQRGFGNSSWSAKKDYGVTAFADDMINLLDHLQWNRVILLGHSMGGRNSAYCAAHNPDRVAALVLVDWSPKTAPQGSKRVRAQNSGLPDAFATVDDAIAYFVNNPTVRNEPDVRARFEEFLMPVDGGLAIKRDTFFRDQSRAAVAAGRAPGMVSDRNRVDMWDVLRRVECPMLVLRGRQSDMFAADTVDEVKAVNSGIKMVEIESGHNVAADNPDALISAARSFIADIEEETLP
jgi:pimeloyl-ACP methyl ester carboxylesterase